MTLVEVKDDKLEIKPVGLRKEKYKTQLKIKFLMNMIYIYFMKGEIIMLIILWELILLVKIENEG